MKSRSLMFKQVIQLGILVFIAIATLVVIGMNFSRILHNMANSFEKDSYQSIDLVLNADRDSYQAYTAFNAAILQQPNSVEYKVWHEEFRSNIDDVNNRMDKIKKIVELSADMQEIRNIDTHATIKQNMDSFFPAFLKWVTDSDAILKQYEKSGNILDIREQLSKNKSLFDNARKEMNTMGETLSIYPKLLADKHMSDSKSKQVLIYIIASLILISAVTFYILTLRRLILRLSILAQKQSQLATGLRQASIQLSHAGQQLSQGSNEQAASIEETSASMEETLSMIQQNVENTRQTRDLSEEASKSSSKGAMKMAGMNNSMDELKRSSNEISKIIKVIDEIAFQTNILALNAAVEAARAGDAGLGFAVVAEEVRNLAQRSAKAAKDTAIIIERNIDLSDKGLVVSNDVNLSLDEISLKTRNVNQLVAEIAAASEEQERGISQVTEAITQMEKVVQQNAATAEESAATSEELLAQAEELENAVFELNEIINGKNDGNIYEKENVKDMQKKKYYSQNNASMSTKYMMSPENTNYIRNDNLKKQNKISPNDVIPLDEDDDF